MSSALLWDITQRGVVVSHWSFGTTYLYHLRGSRSPSAWTDILSPKHRCEITTLRRVVLGNSADLVILNSLKVDQLFQKLKRGLAQAHTDAHSMLLSRCCFLYLRFLKWNWVYLWCHLMKSMNISRKITKCRWRKPCFYFLLFRGNKWTNAARLFCDWDSLHQCWNTLNYEHNQRYATI